MPSSPTRCRLKTRRWPWTGGSASSSHARTRGCGIFYLTTLSYQAPDFYRHHGYEVLARIDGYPDGIAKFLMHKAEAHPLPEGPR